MLYADDVLYPTIPDQVVLSAQCLVNPVDAVNTSGLDQRKPENDTFSALKLGSKLSGSHMSMSG